MAKTNAFDVMMKGKKGLTTSAFSMSKPLKKRKASYPPLPMTETRRGNTDISQKKPKQQLFLDLGQKDIGERTCPTCGFLYMNGIESDEKAHNQHCKKIAKGIVIVGWKNERIHFIDDELCGRIIEIRSDDPPAHIKKLRQIKEILDDALGFIEESTFLEQNHFIYLLQNRVVGVVAAETVHTAFEMLESEIVAIDPAIPHKVLVGVSHMWVHPSHRRQHIAQTLIDTMRQKFSYGMVIPKSKCAFSQPTQDGIRFAKQYSSPFPLLIYSTTKAE